MHADLILVMDASHRVGIKKLNSSALDKTFYLARFNSSAAAPIIIMDPYGASEEVFEGCFDQIDAALEGLVKCLR
jgi:protein-tyrosine-phosphatase